MKTHFLVNYYGRWNHARRKAYQRLEDWKRQDKQALLVKEARQVGKTLVEPVCRRQLWDPRRGELLRQQDCQRDGHEGDWCWWPATTSFSAGKNWKAGKTLVFTDEIQEWCQDYSPGSKMLLRRTDWLHSFRLSAGAWGIQYFLLPLVLQEVTLYPLDFWGVLLGKWDRQDWHWKLFLPVWNPAHPVPDYLHEAYGYLYRYLLVGNMPDVVQAVDNNDLLASRNPAENWLCTEMGMAKAVSGYAGAPGTR